MLKKKTTSMTVRRAFRSDYPMRDHLGMISLCRCLSIVERKPHTTDESKYQANASLTISLLP